MLILNTQFTPVHASQRLLRFLLDCDRQAIAARWPSDVWCTFDIPVEIRSGHEDYLFYDVHCRSSDHTMLSRRLRKSTEDPGIEVTENTDLFDMEGDFDWAPRDDYDQMHKHNEQAIHTRSLLDSRFKDTQAIEERIHQLRSEIAQYPERAHAYAGQLAQLQDDWHRSFHEHNQAIAPISADPAFLSPPVRPIDRGYLDEGEEEHRGGY